MRQGVVRTATGVIRGVLAAALLVWPTAGWAQRVRLPQATGAGLAPSSYAGAGYQGSSSSSFSGAPGVAPVPQPPAAPGVGGVLGSATLGQPSFDPYSTSPDAAAAASPSLLGAPTVAPGFGAPSPYGAPATQPFGGYPSTAFPSQSPPVMFPNGLPWGNSVAVPAPTTRALKLIQGIRFRYGYLYGRNDPRELGINEFDTSVPVAFPNFLFTGQPVWVVPSFSLQLWDGPHSLPADLPPQTYAAFLDAGWKSDPNVRFGGEAGFRIGAWTDFNTLVTDSLRIQGVGLLRLNLTRTLTVRGGVMYVDRLRRNLIPAGGVLWQPTPQKKWDIFFPQPKLSCYWTTLGNQDMWWYLTGQWGGDTWTITRSVRQPNGGFGAPYVDRFDYSDIRLMGGIEWGPQNLIDQGRRLGFLEAGWVLDRDVEYELRPQDDFTLRDTFIIRGGIGY